MESRACFLFNDTATTEIYTLPLHDALPIFQQNAHGRPLAAAYSVRAFPQAPVSTPLSPRERRRFGERDGKSTRLNSTHQIISYAVFFWNKEPGRALHLRAAA